MGLASYFSKMNSNIPYDLKTQLIPASKEMTEEVALICLAQNELLDQLIVIALSKEKVVSWHACWVVEKIAGKDKSKLIKFTNLLIEALPNLKHPSQIRPIFGAVAILDFDCERHLSLIDFCIQKLTNSKSPYNEKSRALLVLEKFIVFEPELKNEFYPLVERLLPLEEKPHFIKRLNSFLSL